MRFSKNIMTVVAAACLSAGFVFGQQEPKPAAPGTPGAAPWRAGFPGMGGDPNRCTAPTGMGAANYKSTEQLPDRQITFRICAPDATAAGFGRSDNEAISPNTFMGGTGRPSGPFSSSGSRGEGSVGRQYLQGVPSPRANGRDMQRVNITKALIQLGLQQNLWV